MANNFNLKLTAKLDSKNIKADIETLTKSLSKKPLKLKLELSKTDKAYLSTIKDIVKQNKALELSFKEVSRSQKTSDSSTKKSTMSMDDYIKKITVAWNKLEQFKNANKNITSGTGMSPVYDLNDLTKKMDLDTLKAMKNELLMMETKLKTIKSINIIEDKDTKTLTDMVNKMELFRQSKDKAFKRNPKLANELNVVQKEATEALGVIENKGTNSKAVIDKLSTDFRQLSADINVAQQKTMSFKEQMAEAGKKFGMWSGVTTLYFKAIEGIKSMITNVIDLDTSLTELRKVTELTDDQIVKFTETAYEAGTEIGRTGKEVIDATQIFSQAGYSISKAFDLSQVALTMMNVGDGIEDVETASQTLISTMKGFGLQTSEAMGIVDKFNKVKYYCLSIQMINV